LQILLVKQAAYWHFSVPQPSTIIEFWECCPTKILT
jgi:hypothetical protein